MNYTYIPNRVIDSDGIADGASIAFYQSGTTTLIPIYSDPGYTTPLINPYIVSLGAVVPNIYWDYEGDVRVVVTARNGEVIEDQDPYSPVQDVALRDSLASPEGAEMVGLPQGGKVADAIKWVSPEMFGPAAGDGVTDDTAYVQAAINYLESIGGGTLLLGKTYLVGGLIVTGEHIVFQGLCRENGFLVKSGTLGIHVQQSWVHFRNMRVWSEGTETDGLNTRGILYSKGSGSTGHVYNHDLNIQNFSGYGMEVRNTLDFVLQSCFFRDCMTGLQFRREGTGPADFSTTIQLIMVYAITCDVGIDLERVRHTRLSHVICEWNRIGMVSNLSDFTTNRCYFENNTEKGIDSINSSIIEGDNYYNAASDGISRSYSGGVIAAADRYYRRNYKGDTVSKRFGLLSGYATEERFLAAVGNTNAIGLKFGEAVVPTVYGNDLLDPGAWESMTGGGFQGWDVAHRGYKIEGTTSGGNVRGMQQSVSLDSTKTYVIAFDATNVAGAALTTVQVDGVTRTPGVPFTVSTSGSKVVRTFAAQTGAYENYVHVFRLMEVLEDQTQIAKTTDILLRTPDQRGKIYMSAPPISGTWARGEIVWNSAPTPGGYIGWVCTSAGSPGTWKGFGAIEV